MFDLREISSVAPVGDLALGIALMLAATSIAHLAIIPKLLSRNARRAKALLILTSFGVIAAIATLAVSPPSLYLATLIYAAAFTVTGLALSWHSIGWRQALARAAVGSACMLVAIAVAHWVAFAPR